MKSYGLQYGRLFFMENFHELVLLVCEWRVYSLASGAVWVKCSHDDKGITNHLAFSDSAKMGVVVTSGDIADALMEVLGEMGMDLDIALDGDQYVVTRKSIHSISEDDMKFLAVNKKAECLHVSGELGVSEKDGTVLMGMLVRQMVGYDL